MDDDYTLMTTDSMNLVLNDKGCCVRHPHIKLKEYDDNGDVYLKESCPECRDEFQKTQDLLREKRRELDLKLLELGEDSPHDERHADFVKMVSPDTIGELKSFQDTPPQTMPKSSSPLMRTPVHDMQGITAQMTHIQHMQDILLFQKDKEVQELRQKVELQQKELVDKEVEIALLKERMSQQKQQMERELKLIQRAVAMDRERRNTQGKVKEIHIGELHVQVAGQQAAGESAKIIDNNLSAMALQAEFECEADDQVMMTESGTGSSPSEAPKEMRAAPASDIVGKEEPLVEESKLPTESVSTLKLAGSGTATAGVVAAATMRKDEEFMPPTLGRFESEGDAPATLGVAPEDDSIIEDSAAGQVQVSAYSTEVESTDLSSTSDLRQPASFTDSREMTLSGAHDQESAKSLHGAEKLIPYWQKKIGEMSSVAAAPSLQNVEGDERKPAAVEDIKLPALAAATTEDKADEEPHMNEASESSSESTEQEDSFDANALGNGPPVTVSPTRRKTKPVTYKKPGPLTTPRTEPLPVEHRPEPLKASLSGPPQPGLHPPSQDIPGVSDLSGHGFVPVEGVELNADAVPIVPLEEQITLDSAFTPTTVSSRFEPRVVTNDDDEQVSVGADTTGPTVATSTYGEDVCVVHDRVLLDPYGDRGTYSGVVLLSTNLPHGNGRMVYEDDGRTFDGDWRHGRWHGWGKSTFSNGDVYQGFYQSDKRHGKGKYQWHDGRSYEGEFKLDKRHGKGRFIWPDGAEYEGDFVEGQRIGHGVYKFRDGGQYVGEWVNGRYEGYGICTWKDGRRYEGEWKNGMAHGLGTETYPDGRVRHSGQWFKDEPVRDDEF